MKLTTKMAALMVAAIGLGATSSAMAALSYVEFSGSGVNSASGTALAGKVTFTVVGNQLTMVLENTGAAAEVPSDVMTGVFFNWAGNTLTADSATGTLINTGAAVPGNTLGGGWAYNSAGNGSTGIGMWGAGDDFFSATQNTPPLNGIDYGIVSAVAVNANNAVKNGNVLASPSVTFYFTITSGLGDLSTLTWSGFNYGTSPGDQTIIVPEPSTVIAAALLLLPFGASTIRILRKNRSV